MYTFYKHIWVCCYLWCYRPSNRNDLQHLSRNTFAKKTQNTFIWLRALLRSSLIGRYTNWHIHSFIHHRKQQWTYCTVMHSRQYTRKISDIETDDSHWGFSRYRVQRDLIVWSQSRQHFVGQSLTCGLDCSTGFMARRVGLALGPPHVEGLRATS